MVAFSHPKALIAHALGLVLCGVLVAYLVRYGRRAVVTSPVHLGVAAFVAVSTLATIFALDLNLALYGAQDRNLGLATTLDNALLYFAAVTFVRTRGSVFAVCSALFAAVIPVTLYQAAQMSGRDPLPWASGFGQSRPFSTLGNAGNLAQYLGTLAAAAAMLALTHAAAVGARLRAVLAIAALLLSLAALLTGTRAVFLGLGAGSAAILGLLVLRAPSQQVRTLAMSAAVPALLIGGAVVLFTPAGRSLQTVLVSAPGLTSERGNAGDGSVGGRLVIYQVALSEIRERPFLGVGPDNFVAAFGRHRPAGAASTFESDAPQTSTHSWLAHVATSTGVAGLFAFAFVLGVALFCAWRNGMPPLAAASTAAVASFLGTGLVSINDIGTEWLLWLAVAAMAAPAPATVALQARSAHKQRKRERAGPTPLRNALAGGAVGLGLLLAAMTTTAHEAAIAAEEARQARGRGDHERARLASQRATALDPGRAVYWNGLGLAFGAAGRPGDAVPAFTKAVQLAPYQAAYQANLTRSLVARGDAESRKLALSVARKAVEADPNVGEPHFVLALALMANGEAARAAAESERGLALQLAPGDRFAAEVAGRAYFELGKMIDSERWLRLAITQSPGREGIEARILLARVLGLTSRKAEAVEQLNAVLAQDPTNQQAIRLRAEFSRP